MTMTRIFFLLLFFPTTLSISIDIRYPQFFSQSLNDSSIEIIEGKTLGSFIAFVSLINTTNILHDQWSLNSTHPDFAIQTTGTTYSLITTRNLDRERQNFYNFSIYAQHHVSPYEYLSKPVRIRILDINDCTPTFNETLYNITLIPQKTNYTIKAYDCDEPNTDNSRISYSLANYQDLFRINQTTGFIECIKNIDASKTYELIIEARDHGKSSLSSRTSVQIKLVASDINERNLDLYSWFKNQQNTKDLIIALSVLVFCSLIICLLICFVNYKAKRCRTTKLNETNRRLPSTSTINSVNDLQQTPVYDAVNIFPNTYYLPVKQIEKFNQNNDASLPSTTSSPVSTNDVGLKISSDDGCYCSSDMSSEQSNNALLLNPSSLTMMSSGNLTSKHVHFNQNHLDIDRILQRFENLYESQTNTDHCASYV